MTDHVSTASSSDIPPSIIAAYANPNHEELSLIREQYHGIIDDLQKKIDESGDAGLSTEELKECLVNTNQVFTKVRRPQEARLDINILKQVTLLSKQNAEKTTSNLLVFKPSEFADKLVTYCKNLTNDGTLDEKEEALFDLPERALRALGSELSSLYSTTCGMEPIYGALDWKPPERKASQRALPSRGTTVTKLVEKVANLTTKEETSLDEVGRILSVLRKKYKERKSKPICYLEFVINPKCFITTIENIFHVSFLLRDGFVEIKPDGDKIACIIPAKITDQGKANLEESIGCQAIVSMDMNEWKEAIDVLELGGKEPMIPFRDKSRKRQQT